MIGFSQNEIEQKSISSLTPKSISVVHDRYVKRYVDTGRYNILYRTNQMFLVHKHGPIVPCNTIIKPLVNLKTKKIMMVALIDQIEHTEHKYMILSGKGEIEEIDANMARFLKIENHLKEFKNLKIPIYLLCPNLYPFFLPSNPPLYIQCLKLAPISLPRSVTP